MMTVRIDSIWKEMREETSQRPTAEGDLHLRRIDPAFPHDLFAGIDSEGRALLAFAVSVRPPGIDIDAGAFHYFRTARSSGGWWMVLRLSASGLEQVFGRLCHDLLDAAKHVQSETALISLFRDRLNLWIQLFQHNAEGVLPEHRLKGLLAELIALEEIATSEILHPSNVVTAWTGPMRFAQDFVFEDRAIEIKTVTPQRDRVSISSEDQLQAAVPIELWIYVMRPAVSGELAMQTLPSTIERIEQILFSFPATLHDFRRKLLEAGYVEHDTYDAYCYVVLGKKRYDVSDNFPKLTPPMLPKGIAELSYSILFSTIDQYLIKENTHGKV